MANHEALEAQQPKKKQKFSLTTTLPSDTELNYLRQLHDLEPDGVVVEGLRLGGFISRILRRAPRGKPQ